MLVVQHSSGGLNSCGWSDSLRVTWLTTDGQADCGWSDSLLRVTSCGNLLCSDGGGQVMTGYVPSVVVIIVSVLEVMVPMLSMTS